MIIKKESYLYAQTPGQFKKNMHSLFMEIDPIYILISSRNTLIYKLRFKLDKFHLSLYEYFIYFSL